MTSAPALAAIREERRNQLALLVVAGLIALDFDLARHVWDQFYLRALARLLMGVGGCFVVLALTKKAPPSLGFQLRPKPSWAYWAKVGALALPTVALLCAGVWLLGGRPGVFWKFESLSDFWLRWVPQAGAIHPLIEEILYRALLVSTLEALWGAWVAIALGGAVFALLHVVYGAAAPENIVGGFILAWPNLQVQLWCYGLIDQWMDAPEVYLGSAGVQGVRFRQSAGGPGPAFAGNHGVHSQRRA